MSIHVGLALLLTTSLLLTAACTPVAREQGADSPYKRHNEAARFGRPDVGGARANDR